MPRPLWEISEDIAADWTNPHYTAVPYLNAMGYLDSMNDRYGSENAESIVLYFLSNAGKWRGPVAASIKKELRNMLKKRGVQAASPARVVQAFLKKERIRG